MPLAVAKKPKRLNFTKANIERLNAPADGRRYVYDVKTPGLALCLTAAGSRTFYLYRKIGGRPERIPIGPWPGFTVERARDEAAKMNGRIADGVNPNDKRRVNRQAPTLGQVFDEYIDTPTRGKSKRQRSPKTIKDYRWQFGAHLEAWRDRQLSKIKRADVERLHGDIGERNGEYLANRILALLRAVLNYAVEQEYYPLNVAARIKGFEERSRDRFVTAEELPNFWAAVESESAADFYKLSLLTGARQANVLAARWEQINLDAALWLIPKTKGGAPFTVPLSATAVELLRRRKASSKSEWVFTRADGITGPMPAPRHGWERILKRAGIEGLRMHDLRRSLASWQASTGANLTVIGKSLGHNSVQATKIYAHADLTSVRDSVETATAAILAAVAAPDYDSLTGPQRNEYQQKKSAEDAIRQAKPLILAAMKDGAPRTALAAVVYEALMPELLARTFQVDCMKRRCKGTRVPISEQIRRGAQLVVDAVLAAAKGGGNGKA